MLIPIGTGDPIVINYGWITLEFILPWVLLFLLLLWACATARRLVRNWREAVQDERARRLKFLR